MDVDDVLGRAGDILLGDRGDHRRRGLDRGALHVMLDAADAAHLLAAAGAAGAAVDQHRQRRAVAGRFGGVGAVDHQHPAVIGGGALDELARGVGRMGEQRQREAAHAAIGERDRVGHVLVGHDRRDRTERLDSRGPRRCSTDRRCAAASATGTRRRRSAARPCGSPATIRAPAASSSAIFARTSSRWLTLTSAPMRVSSARGSPTLVLASRSRQRLLDRVEIVGRRHRAADGGAFLPRLDRHLGRDFLDEQVELGRARRGVGAEQRGVEAILLGDEAARIRA